MTSYNILTTTQQSVKMVIREAVKAKAMGTGTGGRRDKLVSQMNAIQPRPVLTKDKAIKLGKGGKNESATERANSHSSAPLTTLKDPDSFGPPPSHSAKREVQTPIHSGVKARSYAATKQPEFSDSKVLSTASKDNSWGAPLPQESVATLQIEGSQAAEEEAAKAVAPSLPYRANTTGLSTVGLPAPPVRRIQQEESPPPPQVRKPAPRPVPRPPPRLPPRQNSNPTEFSEPAPPPYTPAGAISPASPPTGRQQPGGSYLNKGSLNRLGQAGVSVPGLDIGRTASPSDTQSTGTISPPPRQSAAPPSGQLSELQARFNRMPGRVSSPTAQSPQGAGMESRGTTWQQKQAALTTANKFHQDPSSVSLSDAKEAGGTLNNFRQRHGEQVAQGWQQAEGLEQKHGIAGRVGAFAESQQQPQQALSTGSTIQPAAPSSMVAGKKAPPPPPKKKAALSSAPVDDADAPPPIPLSSKPRQ